MASAGVGRQVALTQHCAAGVFELLLVERSQGLYDASHAGGDFENFIWVEHRDGSVARYLHLKKNGISNVNPVLVSNSTGSGPMFRSDVHVHAGQTLAEAGNTGVSRFPHIHLGMYTRALPNPTGYRHPGSPLGLTFRDTSVMAHGGKCYTFRPYQSDNADRGPISV